MNRELRGALLLLLAGSGLVLLGAGRDWVDATFPARPPLPPVTQTLTGAQVAPGLTALALLGLAGTAALAASRGRGRVAVGVLLALAGAAVVATTAVAFAGGTASALREAAEPGVEVPATALPGFALSWVSLVVLGGLLVLASGLVVAVRGPRWSALSARYEAPGGARAARPARPEVAAWDALDRGEDPTDLEPAGDEPADGSPTAGPDEPRLGS